MTASPVAAAKPEILLVDDQLQTLKLLAIMLNSQGYLVRQVVSGSHALKSIQEHSPDLILLDIRMPGMDGYEVCQRLKADEATCEIPVIFLSAVNTTLDKVKAFSVGGADFIAKPFQFAEILARVENQIKLRSLQQQLQTQNQRLQKEIQYRQQIEASLRLQADKEKSLKRVIQEIRQSLDLNTVFFTAISEIGQLLKLDFAHILRYLPDQHIWLSVAEYRESPQGQLVLDPNLPDRGSAVTAKLKRLETIQLNEAGQLQDEIHRTLAQKSPGAWVLVPLQGGQDQSVWGCLSLLRQQPSPWQESEVESAKTLASQLAIAIEQGELYHRLQAANQELERLATMDGLTQVANRRHFNHYLDLQWREARREQSPLSVILCDVDFFKKYNDTYGHLAGDDCLKAVAKALKEAIKRPDDLVARYGGEEFAVILPRTDLTGAAYMAQALRLEVQRLQIPHGSSSVKEIVSLSLGVASVIPTDDLSIEILLSQADQALYQAKAAGRDRLALHGLASISSVA